MTRAIEAQQAPRPEWQTAAIAAWEALVAARDRAEAEAEEEQRQRRLDLLAQGLERCGVPAWGVVDRTRPSISIDGFTFELASAHYKAPVVLVATCPRCRVTMRSAVLTSRVDLGEALARGEPACSHECPQDDAPPGQPSESTDLASPAERRLLAALGEWLAEVTGG